MSDISFQATDPEYEMPRSEAEGMLLRGNIQRELHKHFDRGVCCFSRKFDDILMWSHYGGQHKGFCVGYSTNRNPIPKLQKVEYINDRTISTKLLARAMVQNDGDAKTKLENDILLRKAKAWEYEDEWRLIDSVGLNDSQMKMEEIIFGVKCPDEIVHSVISALEGRTDVDFYNITIDVGSFVLEKKAINTDELAMRFPRIAESGVEIFGDVSDLP